METNNIKELVHKQMIELEPSSNTASLVISQLTDQTGETYYFCGVQSGIGEDCQYPDEWYKINKELYALMLIHLGNPSPIRF